MIFVFTNMSVIPVSTSRNYHIAFCHSGKTLGYNTTDANLSSIMETYCLDTPNTNSVTAVQAKRSYNQEGTAEAVVKYNKFFNGSEFGILLADVAGNFSGQVINADFNENTMNFYDLDDHNIAANYGACRVVS